MITTRIITPYELATERKAMPPIGLIQYETRHVKRQRLYENIATACAALLFAAIVFMFFIGG